MQQETLVDLNYLFHRQQIETARARSAACHASRLAHGALARAYDREIASYRRRRCPEDA